MPRMLKMAIPYSLRQTKPNSKLDQ